MRYRKIISSLSDPHAILRHYWGYDSFRPLQLEIIENILKGRDTLGLMPTGGGKSITFQVPALMNQGLTLVITPLISLMKDQTDNLLQRGIRAVYLQAGMTSAEIRKAHEILANTDCRFLYVSPERLQSEKFCSELKDLNVRLIVVDEAHCISQWGYDFRPAYLQIHKLRSQLENVPLLALTATATKEVAEDICTRLKFGEDARIFSKSFKRKNISYIVRPTGDKYAETLHILKNTRGAAIVYVRSRKAVREIADFLNNGGFSAIPYHAGMNREEKENNQAQWIEGNYRVIVATNAFGMGIDKPDVRTVIHFNLPPSLEEYYQEAGRAGRDGATSYAVLLTSKTDPAVLSRRLTEAFPDKNIVRKVYERVCNFLHISLEEGFERMFEFSIDKFCATFSMQRRQVESALKILTASGYMTYIEETSTRPRVMVTANRETLYNTEIPEIADRVLQALLRNYSGLFSDYAYIGENQLAIATGLKPEVVVDTLIFLQKQKIISFIPRKRTPYIYMPNPRIEADRLIIPRFAYEQRRESMRKRLNAMGEYAFTNSKCRENMMLSYFGEHSPQPCGQCDVCRASKKNKTTKINDIDLCHLLLEYIRRQPDGATYPMLANEFKLYSSQIPGLLQFMLDEGMLTLDAVGRYTTS